MPTATVRTQSPTRRLISQVAVTLDGLRGGTPLSSAQRHQLSTFADELLDCAHGVRPSELRDTVGRVWLRATSPNGTITEWYERYATAARTLKRLAREDDHVPEDMYDLIVLL